MKILSHLGASALLFGSFFAAGHAIAAQSPPTTITAVNQNAGNGTLYLTFANLNHGACGDTLRVRHTDPGYEGILKVALAAALSKASVIAGHEDTKDGSYCNLNWVQMTP